MPDNILTFPGASPDHENTTDGARTYERRTAKNMHTVLFRSRSSILESDEADLVRDVALDIAKAERKLRKIPCRRGSRTRFGGRPSGS